MNHSDTKLTGPEIFHSLHVYADRFEELGWIEERKGLIEERKGLIDVLAQLENRLGLVVAQIAQVQSGDVVATHHGQARVQLHLEMLGGLRAGQKYIWACDAHRLLDFLEFGVLCKAAGLDEELGELIRSGHFGVVDIEIAHFNSPDVSSGTRASDATLAFLDRLAKAQPRVLVFLKEVTYEGDSRGYTQLVIKGVAPQE